MIEVKILDDRLTEAPAYASAGAAAIDLRACSVIEYRAGCSAQTRLLGPLTMRPGDRVKIGTGVAFDLRERTGLQGAHIIELYDLTSLAGLILPRSGLGSRGLMLQNTVGLIDSDYQGEILLMAWNAGNDVITIQPLDRIAQMLIIEPIRPSFAVVSEFSRSTERGADGFGSTGAA